MTENENQWTEEISADFLDYGKYMVPERERQMAIMVGLLPPSRTADGPGALLWRRSIGRRRYYGSGLRQSVYGYDGSTAMLAASAKRLAWAGRRFHTRQFDLGDHVWRKLAFQPEAIVSSLAIQSFGRCGQGPIV